VEEIRQLPELAKEAAVDTAVDLAEELVAAWGRVAESAQQYAKQ
jgi:hypothetical protein